MCIKNSNIFIIFIYKNWKKSLQIKTSKYLVIFKEKENVKKMKQNNFKKWFYCTNMCPIKITTWNSQNWMKSMNNKIFFYT